MSPYILFRLFYHAHFCGSLATSALQQSSMKQYKTLSHQWESMMEDFKGLCRSRRACWSQCEIWLAWWRQRWNYTLTPSGASQNPSSNIWYQLQLLIVCSGRLAKRPLQWFKLSETKKAGANTFASERATCWQSVGVPEVKDGASLNRELQLHVLNSRCKEKPVS